MGLNENTAKRHWQRQRIPAEYWPRLIEVCRARDWYDVTADSLLAGLCEDLSKKRGGLGNGRMMAECVA